MRQIAHSVVLLALAWTARARADDAAGSTTVRAAANPDGAVVTRVSPDDYPGQSMHVGDLVSAAPGVAVLDYGGMLATTTVSIRGATADEVQVVLGGVPLNATAGGGFDLSLIPAALIDSVDVRRGSEGQEFGAGAMGGTVVLEPVSRTRVLLTGGSLGTYGASGSFATPVSAWRILVAGDVRHTDGDFAYQYAVTPELPTELVSGTRLNNDATIGSLLLRAERTFDSSAKFSAMLWAAGIDRGIPSPIYSVPVDSRQHEGTGLADIRFETPTGAWGRLELPLSVRGDVYRSLDAAITEEDGLQHTIDTSTRPSYVLSIGPWSLRISGLAGYETLNGPEFGFHDRVRGALGGDVTWQHGRWTAFAGIREEKWGAAAAFLPRAGGTIGLVPGLTLAASAGLGFRPPSFGELYYSAGPVLANPQLQPERSDSGDVSLRFRRWGLSGAVTGFAGWYQDIIVYEGDFAGEVKPFNVGNARCLGGEIELHWRPPLRVLHGAEVSGSYTRSEAVNLDPLPAYDGKLLPYRPEDRGNVRVAYTRERWRAAVELQVTGAAWTDRANTESVGAFADLRGSAGVRLWRAFWLSAEVRNALDELNRMVISEYPLPGRVFLAHLSWEPDDAPGFDEGAR